jgi:branched-chain amino acid transport system permease protein
MLAEQIINGIVLGSMYALVALGYTLVFGVLDKLNFAHGETFMLGGFVAVAASALGAPLWVAFPCALLICGALGLVVELLSFRKFRSADAQVTAALSSLALGLVLIDLVQKSYGSEPVPLELPLAVRTATVSIAGIEIAQIKLAILAIALLLMGGLQMVVTRTRVGRNIRAVAESPLAAALLGIHVRLVMQQTFVIASALAGIAGVMLAMRTGYAASDIGFTFGIKALAIMAIGGMGDLRGAMLGGILVGIVEALAVQLGFGKLGEIVVWILMIIVLLVKPGGLFSTSTEQRA